MDNLQGSITNSNLEHASLLGQVSLMVTTHDVTYATISNSSNNTPAVSHMCKGAMSSDGPTSFLCNLTCTHQC